MKLSLLFLCIFIQLSFGQKNLDKLLKKHNDNGVPYISVEELSMPKTKVILLDTREKEEFNISHLKNAIHIGYNNFDIKNIELQIPDKNSKIVVYCSLGIRSETIGEYLKASGYTNVKNLYGGIFQWKNKNYKVYKNNIETDTIHTFSKSWSKWLKKGVIYYPKTTTNEQ